MYTIKNDICNYKFTPGWFDDIAVKDMQVLWKADDVLKATTKQRNSDGYYVWKDSLKKGEKLQVELEYKTSAFQDLNVNKQVTNIPKKQYNSQEKGLWAAMILVFIAFFYLILFTPSYRSRRGFGYGYGYRRRHYHSSCVSSCACACACAGGGRAGCSRKDFYGTKLKVSDINNTLNKK